MKTRREFLKTTSLVSLAPVLPSVFGQTARVAGSDSSARVLVVIQLDGGNDGIDKIYESIASRVKLIEGIHETEYGMREFIIADLNGFWITFGQKV
jgi:hypothetical protein